MSCGPKPRISLKEAEELAWRLNVNLNVVDLREWRQGIETELEHWQTINCDVLSVAKIARDHLEEFPNYYQALEEMEDRLRHYWQGKVKPRVVLRY